MTVSESKDKISQFNRLELEGIYLYRNEQTDRADWVDISSLLVQFDIFEDIMAVNGSITATITINDSINLVDLLPIVGGERIRIEFRTPSFEETRSQEFSIYKIGYRKSFSDSSLNQIYTLYMSTTDFYKDYGDEFSVHLEGTYSDIVETLLGRLNSDKENEIDESLGNKEFITPFWTSLQTCRTLAKNSVDVNGSSFMFYETLSKYKFKSLFNLYQQEPYTTLFIEPRTSETTLHDPEKALNVILEYEILESMDKLKFIKSGALGAKYFSIDTDDMNIYTGLYDYSNAFGDMPSVEEYSLIDIDTHHREIVKFDLSGKDESGKPFERNAQIILMDAFKMRVKIVGNSELEVGSIVELNIPLKSGAIVSGTSEYTTSGRWFVTSVRHVIQVDSYVSILELTKDSLKNKLRSILK